MTNNQIQLGNEIKRISNHCTGEVIELDAVNRRARIGWKQPTSPNAKPKPRTWVSFSDLVVIAPCVPVRLMRSSSNFGEWIATPNSTQHSHLRICSNDERGEEWHEYKKR
jgi:hypothetical protein